MTDRLALPLRYRKQLKALLDEHVPGVEVWAYGSRVNGESHEGSDLDLALRGPSQEPLDGGFYDLLEAIEKSNIPILIQTNDWAMLPESFHREIERDYIVVQEGMGTHTKAREWREVTLAEAPIAIIDGDRGKNYPKQHEFLESGHCLFLNAGNVTSDGFNLSSCAFVSSDRDQRLRKGKLNRHDVVLTTRGTVGNSAYFDATIPYEHVRINSGMVILRALQPALHPRYLYILTQSQLFLSQVQALRTGSAQPQLPIRDIERITIPLPPLPEQRAIAHVLGTLDDKIELNRRINETLEAMARALFKSWFVDFDPVRAKMEGRWHRGESLPGFPAEHYDLFSDRLVYSELGPIPEGWEVKGLGDCFNLTMGQSPPGSTYNDDGNGTPFYQGSTDFGERYPTNRRYCTEPARLAQTEDTLVSVRAPVGAINRAWERCCIGRGVAALRHKSGSAPYTYYAIWAAQPEIGQYEHTGTVFGAIGGQQFRALLMLEPHDKTVAAFHRIGQDLDNRIRSNVAESRALTTQRDALLPGLMSREVAITHTERWLSSNED